MTIPGFDGEFRQIPFSPEISCIQRKPGVRQRLQGRQGHLFSRIRIFLNISRISINNEKRLSAWRLIKAANKQHMRKKLFFIRSKKGEMQQNWTSRIEQFKTDGSV
jgi:hypothetical protein